jgi:BCD family chlorophyll transporter-like MFS transporter
MGVLLAMVIGAYLTRRRSPDRQVNTTAWGLAILAGPLFLLGLSSVVQIQSLLRPLLFVFGVGLGIFSVGGVALLMAMSREQQAGAYLALWSMIQLIARGAGIAAGGLLRDLALSTTGSMGLAYGFVFAFEAVGILVCILLLRRVDVPGFVRLPARADAAPLPAPAVFD